MHEMKRLDCLAVLSFVFCLACSGAELFVADAAPLDIGNRRELFVDEFLIAKRDGVELRMRPPPPREIVFVCDAPWEGSGCGYETIFRDGDLIRMYYVATDLTNADGTKLASRPIYACYAESKDGIHWVKPHLGLFEFKGSNFGDVSCFHLVPYCHPGKQKAESS